MMVFDINPASWDSKNSLFSSKKKIIFMSD